MNVELDVPQNTDIWSVVHIDAFCWNEPLGVMMMPTVAEGAAAPKGSNGSFVNNTRGGYAYPTPGSSITMDDTVWDPADPVITQ